VQKYLQTTALLTVFSGVLMGAAVMPQSSFAQATGGQGSGAQGNPEDIFVEDEPDFEADIIDLASIGDEGGDIGGGPGDADGDGTPDASDDTPEAEYDDTDPAGLADDVVADFNESVAFCRAIGSDEYVIDCLSERLATIAAKLPATGDFAQMRTALRTASADLGNIAAQNPSAVLPSGIARSTGPAATATTRPLRPVATETLAASLQAADAVIARTQVALLRSSSGTQARSLEFQQVAAVVGTSRTLLRSA
jgi:hypothetical protein